jgi:hypothetical protein
LIRKDITETLTWRYLGKTKKAKRDDHFLNHRERKVSRMARKISTLLAVFIVVVAFLCMAQAEEQKWKKTVTLPNGETVLDMSGEWDAFTQYYGAWAQGGEWREKINITQEGSSFVGLLPTDRSGMKKGSILVNGAVHKDGFKYANVGTGWGLYIGGTQISEEGNKVEIDAFDKVRVILRRPKERVAAISAGPKPEVTERIKLRDKAEKNFSDSDLQKMVTQRNFFHSKSYPEGNFPNDLVDNGNGTITDKVTGLMWQKGGSPSEMKFDAAVKYVEDLNSSRVGGHSDWRLPTMEELCSLLEGTPNKSEMFMGDLFDPAQSLCWSADVDPKARPTGGIAVQAAFVVNFVRGETSVGIADKFASPNMTQGSYYVKAVRTAQ